MYEWASCLFFLVVLDNEFSRNTCNRIESQSHSKRTNEPDRFVKFYWFQVVCSNCNHFHCICFKFICVHFLLSVCRYFLNGINCRYGSHCRYLHPQPTEMSQNDSVETCAIISNEASSSSVPANTIDHIPMSSYLSVDAPEFVPSNFLSSQHLPTTATTMTNENATDVDATHLISYAQIVSGNASNTANVFEHIEFIPNSLGGATLCPYLNRIATADGLMCPYGPSCVYQHGDLCDICGDYCLHPTDETQRREHQNVNWIFTFR